MPDPTVQRGRRRTVLHGDPPNPANPPTGCNFRTRCPLAVPECAQIDPSLRVVASGHRVACIRVGTPNPTTPAEHLTTRS